ncbi:MAG: RsmE family RNA methyltransferase [Dehalococcoidia bacterium]
MIAAATTSKVVPESYQCAVRRGGRGRMAWAAGSKLLPDSGKLAVLVGPEGGWSEAELARARSSGGIVLRLGANILRTETAAIAALTLIRGRA